MYPGYFFSCDYVETNIFKYQTSKNISVSSLSMNLRWLKARCRPNPYKLQIRKKQLKRNYELILTFVLILLLYNLQYDTIHKSKMIQNERCNFHTKTVQITDQKKFNKVTNNLNQPYHISH